MHTAFLEAIINRGVRSAGALALVTNTETCTFGELCGRAEWIRGMLAPTSFGMVAIYGHKESVAVAAMLACMLEGRPFVFIDVANPAPRISQILKVSGAIIMLHSRKPASANDIPLMDISADVGVLNIVPDVGHYEGLLYMCFTSGSSGAPKGVKITWENFAVFCEWYQKLIVPSVKGEAHVNHASLSFDMGMLDIWPSLAVGKAVFMLDHSNNWRTTANINFLTSNERLRATSWFSTPSFLEMMCQDLGFSSNRMPYLENIFLGGEPVSKRLVECLMKKFPGAKVWNAYGPTEVTCLTHCRCLKEEDLFGVNPLPLGKAVPPNCVIVVDGSTKALFPDEIGEVVLLGPQVSPGYADRKAIQENVFTFISGIPAYRTGDFGTIDQNGELRIHGRIDRQLKFNGNRVEPAEIERVAYELTGVKRAVVVPKRLGGRVIGLTMFVQLEDVQPAILRTHLNASLPAYMRPKTIQILRSFPITSNGKVDLRALESIAECEKR